MIETIEFKGELYPKFQSEGNAAQFALPFAKQVCKGRGYDIGCNRLEWSFPGSIPIDIAFKDKIITIDYGRELFDHKNYHALDLPDEKVDYIFSSHCLEHIPDWVAVLDYWTTKIKDGGTLFLYLPDYSQKYWRPWNNRKHVNILSDRMIGHYLIDRGYSKVFCSGVDLNNSFMVMAEK